MTAFFIRERPPLPIVAYAIYLYLSGLSLRKAARALGFSMLWITLDEPRFLDPSVRHKYL